jgi:hypothetical protein
VGYWHIKEIGEAYNLLFPAASVYDAILMEFRATVSISAIAEVICFLIFGGIV